MESSFIKVSHKGLCDWQTRSVRSLRSVRLKKDVLTRAVLYIYVPMQVYGRVCQNPLYCTALVCTNNERCLLVRLLNN